MVGFLLSEGGIFCNPASVAPWLFFDVIFGALCIIPVYFVVLSLFLMNFNFDYQKKKKKKKPRNMYIIFLQHGPISLGFCWVKKQHLEKKERERERET